MRIVNTIDVCLDMRVGLCMDMRVDMHTSSCSFASKAFFIPSVMPCFSASSFSFRIIFAIFSFSFFSCFSSSSTACFSLFPDCPDSDDALDTAGRSPFLNNSSMLTKSAILARHLVSPKCSVR